MKKAQILKLVPQRAALKSDLKAKSKQLTKLEKEIDTLAEQVNAIEGVTVHAEFPLVVVDEIDVEFEVLPADDSDERYARAEQAGDGKFTLTLSGKTTDVVPGLSRKEALLKAKNFIAKVKEVPVVPKKRGRPKKNAA